jgi:DNA polymerase sigma
MSLGKYMQCSFAPVVLFLKVLLGQQKLDKPFTGGLGSYKLYVLVAHHVSCWVLLVSRSVFVKDCSANDI